MGDLQLLHKCLLAFPLFITSEYRDGPCYALVSLHFYDVVEHTLMSSTEGPLYVCVWLFVCFFLYLQAIQYICALIYIYIYFNM